MNQTDVLKMMNTASRPESRNGLWTGRVEAIDDPEFMDRVKVRVFAIHGDNRQTPVEALPWAEVQGLEGGGSDYGTAGRRYPIGSSVWVQFEQGDDDFPVVTGARRCKAPVRNDKNPLEFMTLGGQEWSTTEQAWTPSETSEMPKDVFASSANEDRHPTRTVWHKSLKGHTIMCEDRDGAEFLRIIDRAGQTIEMSCPVTVEANANNGEQRGSKSSITDDQVSQDKLVNGRAFIRLKDVSGQEITLDGASANESITIKSRNRNNTAVQKITLSSAKGREP